MLYIHDLSSVKMAEDLSEVWPGPEDVALPESENEDTDLIEEEEDSDVQEDIAGGEEKGKGKELFTKKHGLMALPSEIRETYVFQWTVWGITSTLCIVNLDHIGR